MQRKKFSCRLMSGGFPKGKVWIRHDSPNDFSFDRRGNTEGVVLLRFQHEAFEVFGFGQIQDYRVVGGSAATLDQAHTATCIGGR